MAAVGAVGVLAAVILIGVVLIIGQGQDPKLETTASTGATTTTPEPSTVPTTLAATTTMSAPTQASLPPVPAPPRLTAPPATDAFYEEDSPAEFWTVVVESAAHSSRGARAAAESEASRASRMGLGGRVIDTNGYPSLTPGYYAAISGEFGTREAADAHRAKVRANGFPDAYRVCVGDVGSCPSDHRGN